MYSEDDKVFINVLRQEMVMEQII